VKRTKRWGLSIALVAAFALVLDLTWAAFREFMASHQVVSGLATEALLLAASFSPSIGSSRPVP
jgi:hypothetical protein